LEIHIDSHTLNDDHIGWTTMSGFNQSCICIPFVSRYFTRPRFDRRYRHTLFNLIHSKYFTRSVIRYHFATNSLNTFLQVMLILITEWARSISLRLGMDKFHLNTCNPRSTFRLPERHLYDYPLIGWRLMASKLSSGSRELHYLRNKIHDIGKSFTKTNTMTRSNCCALFGSVHHIIHLMIWSHYLLTNHIYG
jgi:hypothetical protein